MMRCGAIGIGGKVRKGKSGGWWPRGQAVVAEGEGFEVGEAGKAGPRGGVGGDAQVHALQGALKRRR